MGRFLLYAIPFVVMLYAFIDCVQTPGVLARALPKWLWLVLIVVVPLIGAVGWLFGGRPARSAVEVDALAGSTRGRGRRRSVAPDDDPAFLRQLSDVEWQRKMRERREHGDDASS
jgi:hypothetical protein